MIENNCHYVIDWGFNEDHSHISEGLGPENVTRLRRLFVGIIRAYTNGKTSIAEKVRCLQRNTRLVFDCLRMTKNTSRFNAA